VVLDVEHDRYRMLETVRQYALEHLDAGEDGNEVRTRHLDFYLALCEAAVPELRGALAGAWLERLDRDRENILAAHRWCDKARDGGALGLRLVRAARSYFYRRGQVDLTYSATLEALGRDGARSRDVARCRALSDAGQFALTMGRPKDALSHLLESLEIAKEIGADDRVAVVLQPIGRTYLSLGETETARGYLDDALGLARKGGDRREIAAAMSVAAQFHRSTGDLDAAERSSSEALAIAREIDEPLGIGVALLNASMIAVVRRRASDALAMLREVAAIDEEMGDTTFRQAVLETASGLAALRTDFEHAMLFYAAAIAEAERLGVQRDPADQAFVDSVTDTLRAAMGSHFDAALSASRALPYDDAITSLRRWVEAQPVS